MRPAWLALLLALTACAPAARIAMPAWQAPLGRDHPLTGRVWDVAAARFIDADTLPSRLAPARFVLLGEQHDNPDHHRLQAGLVRALAATGRRPAVALEMLDTAQAPALARHLAASPRDAAALGDAVNWRRSGWPPWSLYEPIARAALDAGLPILAANLPAATIAAVVRGNPSALPPSLVATHALDRALPGPMQAAMAADIRDAHCGHATEPMLARMITAQRARDAHMADILLTAASDGAVLIAGTGHARHDRGVPTYIRARAPHATTAVLAFLEVHPAAPNPEAYAARFNATSLPFDYVWFTPGMDDSDPCETFRRSLERLRRR
ncbi:MAG TPA: ChaN family lipoprotein [Candidatus Limnocylindria bacterium]|nr:ChaN family lipoprotein [Candidatus Limnocylindria bacterium]